MHQRTHRRAHVAIEADLPLFDQVTKQSAALASAQPACVTSGLHNLDALLGGGFRAGAVSVLAARPKMGATSLLLGSVLAAIRAKQRVAYLSERLTEAQLRGRLVVLEARVNGHRFRARLVAPEDRIALAAARDRILWQALTFVAVPRLNVSMLERHLSRRRPRLVIFDGLPRAAGAAAGPLRYAELVEGVDVLGRIAKQHHVALVLRLVLPRAAEAPSRYELPGRGALSQRVDDVLLLHRSDAVDDASGVLGAAEVQIVRLSGRDMAPERVGLRFDHRYAGFSDA